MLSAWIARWEGEELPEGWEGCLCVEERASLVGLPIEAARQKALAALLLRAAVKRACGFAPTPEDWARAPWGKPYFPAHPRLCFNLSHSADVVLCVLGDTPVGADIQAIVPERPRLTQYALGSAAAARVQCHPKPALAFAQAWALRESWLKYTGEGLRALRRAPDVYPTEQGEIAGAGRDCVFTLLPAPEGFACAVCAAQACPDPLCIPAQEWRTAWQ
ncbi:MAG: 4'-phosphopantetheinyl transferase superfamily protein [Eubacteriales bacterium]|nr:4'-phosphopantetheinyl transferase superfamily protein [Eubacteriales bacterium]